MAVTPILIKNIELKHNGGGINPIKSITRVSSPGANNSKLSNWISVESPVNKSGIVKLKIMYFKSRHELKEYAKEHNISVK